MVPGDTLRKVYCDKVYLTSKTSNFVTLRICVVLAEPRVPAALLFGETRCAELWKVNSVSPNSGY